MPGCSTRRDWRHCVGLSVTAAGVLKECDFSEADYKFAEADSVTFLLARDFQTIRAHLKKLDGLNPIVMNG
jgi:hypothetical protein